MMREYGRADSLARLLLGSREPGARDVGYELRIMLLRERGQLRESNRVADEYWAARPTGPRDLELVVGNNLGRLGDYAGAARLYERLTHTVPMSQLRFPLAPGVARAYTWHHALLADAIAPMGDTARLRALADSLILFSAGSYYGRDWRLHHHVRGLIAAHNGRYEDAIKEFRAAMWGAAGWTRTNVEMAKAELALGRPRDAIGTLRTAYAAPLDAMGRYQLRTEVDLLMARAFRQAGQEDSAAIYGAYVRRAWHDADPEVARELEEIAN
jgi:tetratricopeptide (TPR) repeat protein